MISFKLSRDNARVIEQNFLPYMIRMAETKLKNVPSLSNEHLNCKIIFSLLLDVQVSFKRKLLSSSNKLSFKLSDAHGIAFYIFMMSRPIDGDQVYINLMRQEICNTIHKQLVEPITEDVIGIDQPDYSYYD